MLFTENSLFGSAGINLLFVRALLQDFLRCDWPLARHQTSQLVKNMSKKCQKFCLVFTGARVAELK